MQHPPAARRTRLRHRLVRLTKSSSSRRSSRTPQTQGAIVMLSKTLGPDYSDTCLVCDNLTDVQQGLGAKNALQAVQVITHLDAKILDSNKRLRQNDWRVAVAGGTVCSNAERRALRALPKASSILHASPRYSPGKGQSNLHWARMTLSSVRRQTRVSLRRNDPRHDFMQAAGRS
jgi:hypothetical protein